MQNLYVIAYFNLFYALKRLHEYFYSLATVPILSTYYFFYKYYI